MAPRTRGCKTLKAKENIGVVDKNKLKSDGKVTKHRKALADKTNSASDDNSSPKNDEKVIKANVKNKHSEKIAVNKERPRRQRRLPTKYNENVILINLSNNMENAASVTNVSKSKTPVKNDSGVLSPFKTPQKDADNSLITNRPKRVCRLPSKFDDHSISPNKFIPVGCHASTPITLNKHTVTSKQAKTANVNQEKSTSIKNTNPMRLSNKEIPQKNQVTVTVNKPSPQEKPVETSIAKVQSDTNNNPTQRVLRVRNTINKLNTSPVKTTTVNQEVKGKKLLTANFSLKVLEEKKKVPKRDSSHLDVYEFTYDPNEEPPPQKKKRKKVVRKKSSKPKTVTFKTNYDRNMSKALAALKSVVSKKPTETQVENKNNNQAIEKQIVSIEKPSVSNPVKAQVAPSQVPHDLTNATGVQNPIHHARNNVSTIVEEIAADFEPLMENDIDYSPVNSPNHGKSPVPETGRFSNIVLHHSRDPLNLQDDISFFDNHPVASSSMNTSVRRPEASPWRVEFDQLPIKWHVNAYVKPDLTPAVECSFVNFDDNKNKKKHVYTNLVPESNDVIPEIVDSNQSNLKQTSIISFIKEVVEKKAKKKKPMTPSKEKSFFEDVNVSVANSNKTPKKTPTKQSDNHVTPNKDHKDDNMLNNLSNLGDHENPNNIIKNKSDKSKEDRDDTYFGFDDSENQENVSPIKINNPKSRNLRPRGRAVLHEINTLSGPTRAKLPLAAKTKIGVSSDEMNKVYEEVKSASDAPVLIERNANTSIEATKVDQCVREDLNDDDSQSVHLFEDVELVHHLKPSRKSYGKVKKVTFQQTTTGDTVFEAEHNKSESSEEDDLADLTFTVPNVEKAKPKKKVKNKKKELSKKEKAEMEAWAAQFNSMCEDVEEFPLVVE